MCFSLFSSLAFISGCGEVAPDDAAPPPTTARHQAGVTISSNGYDQEEQTLSGGPYFPVASWRPTQWWDRVADGSDCRVAERFDELVRPRDTNAGTIAIGTSTGVVAAFDYEEAGDRYVRRDLGRAHDDIERETITLSGSGSATVPAFQVAVPPLAPLTLSAPRSAPLSPEAALPVVGTGAVDFVLRWTTSDPAPISIALGGPTGTITCTFDAHRGYGVVPGALMKDAFASAPEVPCIGRASPMIVRELVTHAAAGDYDLEIRRAERRLIRLMMKP